MKTKMRSWFWLPLLAGALFFLAGCYPNKIDYVDEYDLAGTLYDETVDFSSFSSFTVIDTIVHLTDEEGEDDPNFSRKHDAYILNLLRDNLRANGYSEIESPDSTNMPDLIVMVNAISSEYLQYWSYYWDYWYWYPGWDWWYPTWGPGWGGWYPWYPPGYVTSYTTGTLIIDAFDANSTGPDDDKIDAVWTGLVDGLLGSSNEEYTEARLEKQINQLFEQSEYFKK